jgi:hypothetical protein
MQPGDEALVVVRLQLDDDASGIVTNRASVVSLYSDPDGSDNADEVSFRVVTGPEVPQPDITPSPTTEPTGTATPSPTAEPGTFTYDLYFRWTLITWYGVDGISTADALTGSGNADGGDNILAIVTAFYGWDGTNQQWLGFFPNAVDIPGANDLVSLRYGGAYWIAINDSDGATWTVLTDDEFEE